MSFITKRERVFNEYDLFDLPARNEGKLKAYASCTDARAWSHFCSDKSEHLVEIIKRNNDTCRPKYVPTEAIVNTLMVGKNAEITRLNRKIEEFEQMLAVYDELELTCEQKCEIGKAHAAIKAANKELDALGFLDLDLSGFTEGIDSEAFETGKSRGDEPSRFQDDETPRSKGDETSCFLSQWTFEKEPIQKETKSNQAGLSCACDASTIAVDPRIQDMQDTIITKDAKLNAMQNTIAVMENDVCEPYCIYAHIYTALEKIFGILCQNDKYKLYLNLMTSGRDTRCIDIKGKILFKLKVLEKFSLALIAPCSQDFSSTSGQDCSCYRAEVVTRVETAFALTSAETKQPCLDNKRAQLVADIMENDEMKEILSKENASLKHDLEIDEFGTDNYNIDSENLKRLKNLQENYDDLMTCYEALKHEKDCLLIRCRENEELEKEYEGLKGQLREYSTLWNEKEHYRRRSAELDNLKEQFMVLADETSNLEVQLKAETEINNVKCKTIDDLRRENLLLEQKINEASMLFEKEKNYLHCKLKECDCKAMCQDQQIRSLSVQVDRLLEHDPEKDQSNEKASIALKDEINSLKEQITNLKDVCYCNDEEKLQNQEEFKSQLLLIHDLKMQVDDWKTNYEKALQQNDYLEKYREDEIQRLMGKNQFLTRDVEEKTKALENLLCVIKHKSQDVNRLSDDMEKVNNKNSELLTKIQSLQENYNQSFTSLDNEKGQAMKSLQLARQESQELLEKVKDYDDILHKQDDLRTSFESQNEEYNNLKAELTKTQNQNKHKLENLSDELQKLRDSHEMLLREKKRLENELQNKTLELDEALYSIQLKNQESEELIDKLNDSENLKTDLFKINDAYARVQLEKKALQTELSDKKNELDKLLILFDNLQSQNELKSQEVESLNRELTDLNKAYANLLTDKNILQSDFDNKSDEINNLYNNLETKIEENKELSQRLTYFEQNQEAFSSNINSLMQENISTKSNLDALKKESDELMEKVKYYETLQSEYDKLKKDHDEIQAEKDKLERELNHQVTDLRRVERENYHLSSQSQDLLSHSEVLEKALINARTELTVRSSLPDNTHVEIIKQIDEMKQEKLSQQIKIRDLLDKLDESENVISNQSEIILARDDRIALLENHINHLEDEVRKLHISLDEVVDTGEQITVHSARKINQSLLSMEAHHSRATHNMKMELAKLQSENTMLEDRLSATKLRNEETARDKHKYISQLSNLQKDWEIVVTDIKQLEMRSVGDSALSPERCDVEDILGSLDRIRRFLDARSSKSTSLEQTLLSVQNSYQIVQNKTDEAKKIVEKEKQKILNEKEEAIKDKINMEKQLIDLKKQLEQQILRDQNLIRNLEAEISNQNLIINKLNQSTKSYISKLENDMKSIQLLYENALQKITALESQIKTLSEEKSKHLVALERTSKDLEEKIKEVGQLNITLAELVKEPGRNMSIQTSGTPTNRNMESQTNNEIKYEESEKSHLKEKYDNLHEIKDISPVPVNKIHDNKSLPNNKNKAVNEVQVLTANIDPTFDYVKGSYLNYKLKQLGPGRLEQYTISCGSESDMKNEGFSTPDGEILSQFVPNSKNSSQVAPKNENFKVIDIYNKKSMHTNSSKVIDNDDTENEVDVNIGAHQIKSPTKSSAFTGFGLTNESFATDSNINNEFKNSNMFASTSEVSTDKDLFVIYKDSESNHDKSYEKKGPWNSNGQSEVVVKAVTVQHNKNDQNPHKRQRSSSKHGKKKEIDISSFTNPEDEEDEEDDSVKHKLKISLPRVENDSPSVEASDAEKRSLDSYTMDIYTSPKAYSTSNYISDIHGKFQGGQLKTPSTHSIPHDEYQYNDATNTKKVTSRNVNKIDSAKSDKKKYNDQKPISRGNFYESESHHKLSRVGADVLLIKSEEDQTEPINSDSSKQKKSRDFALEYILDTHNDPDNINTYNAAKAVRKTRSDVRFDLNKLPERTEFSSPSRLSELKKSSTDYKTISSNGYSKSTDKSQQKLYNECSVMVKLDTVEEYENKIQHLTKTLENIEKDYKKKIDAIKMQYDNNIKSILNEHNQGVESIQSLHEETLQDILKIHENEVENLRTMSIEAMRKADKLERENKTLKNKILDSSSCLDEEPIKISTPELRRKKRSRVDPKLLTKTNVEAFNVKPISKHGPCTCSLDINISDTIRNIFEQVDVEQRKMAEYTYLKYIANKIMNGNVDALDTQELSFLHLKVCRIWKTKLTKEESLQKRIDSLEAELMNKQKHAQQNIAELDRKVAEERRRLQEVREAVCRNATVADQGYVPPAPPPTAQKDFLGCRCTDGNQDLSERRSAGDLAPVPSGLRPKRTRNESNRAVLAKLDVEERREREKKMYTDELPTRLRKSQDHRPLRPSRK